MALAKSRTWRGIHHDHRQARRRQGGSGRLLVAATGFQHDRCRLQRTERGTEFLEPLRCICHLPGAPVGQDPNIEVCLGDINADGERAPSLTPLSMVRRYSPPWPFLAMRGQRAAPGNCAGSRGRGRGCGAIHATERSRWTKGRHDLPRTGAAEEAVPPVRHIVKKCCGIQSNIQGQARAVGAVARRPGLPTPGQNCDTSLHEAQERLRLHGHQRRRIPLRDLGREPEPVDEQDLRGRSPFPVRYRLQQIQHHRLRCEQLQR